MTWSPDFSWMPSMLPKDIKPWKIDTSETGVWFTSDLHFGHRFILDVTHRPWKDVDEMDEALIFNWNSTVGDNDIVFDLGDFAFLPNHKWKEYLDRLKGRHVLIIGNHDVKRLPSGSVLEKFERIENQMRLTIDGIPVLLNHYPFLCYAGTYNRGVKTIQLFGHVHSGNDHKGLDDERLQWLFPYQYDVGVDNNDYKPVSWKQVLEKIGYEIPGNRSVLRQD